MLTRGRRGPGLLANTDREGLASMLRLRTRSPEEPNQAGETNSNVLNDYSMSAISSEGGRRFAGEMTTNAAPTARFEVVVFDTMRRP